jgi:hypothetical protein
LDKEVEEKKERQVSLTTIKAKKEIGQFDVFLAHNSLDKEQVEAIAKELICRGLNPWLDKWNLSPGTVFQEEIERILPNIGSVAVFVGKSGIGPWEDLEMRAAISQFVRRRLPVIPVLLPDVGTIPGLPLFLREFSWISLTNETMDEALDNLEWGITGKHPRRAPK